MRFSKTIDRKEATPIIVYKLIESIGVTTVYQIIKCDKQHNTMSYIARNIVSKEATMLIWNDVLSGIQK